METLTDREDEVLCKIVTYVANYHNFPTHRWLVENTQITTTSMVAYYIDKLLKKKFLLKKKVNGKYEYSVANSSWIPPYFMHSIVFQEIGNEEVLKLEIVNTQGEDDG